jgi:hypothetical protein
MADFPQLVKTWQFNVNQLLVETNAQLTDARFMLWALIDSLLGFTSNPWTISSSNNMVNTTVASGSNNVNINTFTGSGVLNVQSTSGAASSGSVLIPSLKAIISYTGISGGNQFTGCTTTYGSGVLQTSQVVHTAPVWASSGTAHSWIVLSQTGISSSFQLLIACSSGTTSYDLNVWFSPSIGFSGGSTTVDPTASDSTPILTNGNWGVQSSAYQYKLHAMQSTDGTCTRVLITQYQAGSSGCVCSGFLSIENAENPVPGWTYPVHVMWLGSTSSPVLTVNTLYQNFNAYSRATANFTLIWTGENINGTFLPTFFLAPNDLSGEWMCMPIGLWSSTVGSRGRHGSLYDIWWGINDNAYPIAGPQGVPFIGANGNTFVQVGALVFPWNSTTMQLS